MIIIRLKGGLGNQLFQYAFGRLLTLKYGASVKYKFFGNGSDIQRDYKLDYFNTKADIATDEEFKKTRYPFLIFSKILETLKTKILRHFNMGYSARLFNKKNGYLEGYWQSYKYLEPIKKELIDELKLKSPIDGNKYPIIKQMETTNSVCVQIRRGDYISNAKNMSEYVTFGMEYYENAFKLIKEKVGNPTLFIVSDDITWCKENIKTDLPIVFTDPNIPDYDNFIIATYCKHNIIANSSFAFWIAWLNKNPNKIVIAPKKWNNRYQKEYLNLLPKEWIQI